MKNNKGFSLIELIVVVAVLGILIGVSSVVASQVAGDTSDIACENRAKQIIQAEELFVAVNKHNSREYLYGEVVGYDAEIVGEYLLDPKGVVTCPDSDTDFLFWGPELDALGYRHIFCPIHGDLGTLPPYGGGGFEPEETGVVTTDDPNETPADNVAPIIIIDPMELGDKSLLSIIFEDNDLIASVDLSYNVYDTDGDTLACTITNCPSDITYTESGLGFVFYLNSYGDLQLGQTNRYSIDYEVSDGALVTSGVITFGIQYFNDSPVAKDVSTIGEPGDSIEINRDNFFSDDGPVTLTFDNAIVSESGNDIVIDIPENASGTIVVNFVVTDAYNGTDNGVLTIQVEEVIRPFFADKSDYYIKTFLTNSLDQYVWNSSYCLRIIDDEGNISRYDSNRTSDVYYVEFGYDSSNIINGGNGTNTIVLDGVFSDYDYEFKSRDRVFFTHIETGNLIKTRNMQYVAFVDSSGNLERYRIDHYWGIIY